MEQEQKESEINQWEMLKRMSPFSRGLLLGLVGISIFQIFYSCTSLYETKRKDDQPKQYQIEREIDNFSRYDLNGDGLLDKEEFRKYIEKTYSH